MKGAKDAQDMNDAKAAKVAKDAKDAKGTGTAKHSKGSKDRKRTEIAHRWLRYAIQAAFFAVAPGAFSGAFNGVKYLFTQVGLMSAIEPTTFVLLLVGLLAFTIVFGRFFCGYACAFGTLGDFLFHSFDFLRSKTPIPRLRLPDGLGRALSLLKFLVLGGICAACFLGAWATVSGMSPWVAFGGIASLSVEGISPYAFAALGAIAIGMITCERFFCRFLCPLGALFALMPVLGFSQFTRVRAHCARKCGKCHGTCPVGIWPDADSIAQGECIACGRCADACPLANVNLVAIEKAASKKGRSDAPREAKPLRKTRESWHMLHGTGAGIVIAKAIALLVVLWVLGATRYLPSFSSLFGPLTLPF